MVAFCIQRAVRREHSKLATLDFVREKIALSRDLLVRVPSNNPWRYEESKKDD